MPKHISQITRLLFHTSQQGVPASIGLLLLRLHVGISMASAGFDKLPAPDWLADQVASMGFPAANIFAIMVSVAEFCGGILVALGLLTRSAALVLAVTIGFAAFSFHGTTPVIQLHITQVLLWSYVLITFVGGGRFSIDALVLREKTIPTQKLRIALGYAATTAVCGIGLFLQFAPSTSEPDSSELTSVSLAGTFNDWDLEATPMAPSDDGMWIATLPLQAGSIEFKFAANGSWNMNCGQFDQESDQLPLAGAGAINDGDDPLNIRATIPADGDYVFAIDPESYAYTLRSAQTVNTQDLVGTWQVDLRPTPMSEPYFQKLVIQSVTNNQFVGSFYDTEIIESRINAQWNGVHFTFVTDPGGRYFSTGRLLNGRLEGTTHSPFQDLFSVWTAIRVEEREDE